MILEGLSYVKDAAGIYKITCTNNGRFYIGSSCNLYKRYKDHIGYLRRNAHFNKHIQNCFNKYGESSLIYEVVKIMDTPDRSEIYLEEQRVISELNPELNILTVVGMPVPSIRPVLQYSLSGEFVAAYPSLSTAADDHSVTSSAIWNAIRGKSRMAANYLWMYRDSDNVPESISALDLTPSKGVSEGSKWSYFWKNGDYKIRQYTKEGTLLGDWESLDSVLKGYPAIQSSYLREHLQGRRSSCGGFVWSLSENFPGCAKRGASRRKSLSLVKGDINLDFDSYVSAANHFGISMHVLLTSLGGGGKFQGWELKA